MASTPEPQVYNAREEVEKQERARGIDSPAPVKEPLDLAKLFARTHDNWRVRTDLDHWMTFSTKDRLDKVRMFTDGNGVLSKAAEPDEKVRLEKKHRYLLEVLFRETMHPDGAYEVCSIALRALYGKIGPK